MRSGLSPRLETSLIAVGFGLLLVHNVDEAFIHPEAGGSFNLAADAVFAVLVLIFARRLPLPWRGGLLALLGILAVVNGLGGHVAHIIAGNATPLDYSGILFVAGGLVLLGLGATYLRIWWVMRAVRRP